MGNTEIMKVVNSKDLQKELAPTYKFADIMRAIYAKNVDEVSKILDATPELLKEKDRGTPLLIVSITKSVDKVTMEILKRGVDVNELDGFGQSPLYVASNGGKLKVVEELIRLGADVNFIGKNGATILLGASSGKGRLKILDLIFKAGFSQDVNAQSKDGTTAIMYAASFKDEETMKLLLDKGADPKIKNKSGKDAFYYGDVTILPRLVSNKKLGKFKDFLEL